jgi:hypothetical protein
VRLTLRGCRARVSGLGIEKVSFRSAERTRDARGPFRARVSGGRLRTRVRTVDGRVVTLDRRLPVGCR